MWNLLAYSGLRGFSIREESSSEGHGQLDAAGSASQMQLQLSPVPPLLSSGDNREKVTGLRCPDFRSRQSPQGNKGLGRRQEGLDGFGPIR